MLLTLLRKEYGLDDSVNGDLANGGTPVSLSTKGTPARNRSPRGRVKIDHEGVPVRVGPPKKRKRRNSSPDEPLSQLMHHQRARSLGRSDRPNRTLGTHASGSRLSTPARPSYARERMVHQEELSVSQADGHEFDDDHDPLALSSPPRSKAELEAAMSIEPPSERNDTGASGVYALLWDDLTRIRTYVPEDKWTTLRDRMAALGQLIGVEIDDAPHPLETMDTRPEVN
ncbi:hypothetical protein FRC04_005672 [Tulasnella sp. 424]|nr:hypothetical protein FRC04_005672 [Tulasnella sp. 424]